MARPSSDERGATLLLVLLLASAFGLLGALQQLEQLRAQTRRANELEALAELRARALALLERRRRHFERRPAPRADCSAGECFAADCGGGRCFFGRYAGSRCEIDAPPAALRPPLAGSSSMRLGAMTEFRCFLASGSSATDAVALYMTTVRARSGERGIVLRALHSARGRHSLHLAVEP